MSNVAVLTGHSLAEETRKPIEKALKVSKRKIRV